MEILLMPVRPDCTVMKKFAVSFGGLVCVKDIADEQVLDDTIEISPVGTIWTKDASMVKTGVVATTDAHPRYVPRRIWKSSVLVISME